jgi:hypothetical protein
MTAPTQSAGNRAALARRLRDLRLLRWPGKSVTQKMLAEALGADKPVSVSLISGWENETSPTTPSAVRLYDYATFFATDRSVTNGHARRLTDDELTEPEAAARDELYRELLSLRTDETNSTERGSLRFDWRFPDGEPIRIVCGKLDYLDGPDKRSHPYSDPGHLNYTDLLTYADSDALIELFGHIRMANPNSEVQFFRSDRLIARPDELMHHVVLLGGVGLNALTKQGFSQARIPIRQVVHPQFSEWGEIFTVTDGKHKGAEFAPTMVDPETCTEDVGLLARTRNPNNPATSLTICDGVFARGVFGAVRALTDETMRRQNQRYLTTRFAGTDRFAIVMRVPVLVSTTMTPDLSNVSTRLFEWPEDAIVDDRDLAS